MFLERHVVSTVNVLPDPFKKGAAPRYHSGGELLYHLPSSQITRHLY